MMIFHNFFRFMFQMCVVLFAVSFLSLSVSSSVEGKTELQFYDPLGGNFTLTAANNKKVHLSDYQGKVVLLTFGYTFCPDICPTILSHLKILLRQLGDSASQVQVLFITIDPERDTADRLQQYVTYFNPSFVGLTGSQAEINKVARQYGVAHFIKKVEGKDPIVAHSAKIYLIDPQGRIRALFTPKTPFDELSGGVKQLLP